MQNSIRNTLIPSINNDIKNDDSSNLKQELTVISNLSDESSEHSSSMLATLSLINILTQHMIIGKKQ